MSINALTNPVIPQYQAEPSVVLIKPEEFRAEANSTLELAVDSSELDSSEVTETASYSPANGLAANGLATNGLGVNALGVNSLGVNALGVNSLGINALGVNSLGINGLAANGLEANGLAANGLAANGLEANGLKTTTTIKDAAAAAIGGAIGAILEQPQAPSPIGPGGIGSLGTTGEALAMFSNLAEALPANAPSEEISATLSSAFSEIEALPEIPLEEITVFKQASNKPSSVWEGSDYNPERSPNDGEGGPPDRADNRVAFGTANDEPIQVQNSSIVDI